MVYLDFSQVQQQPTTAVLELAAAGDPRERVWAAWAIGLRAPQAHDWIAERARLDPEPGVRRHLAVMLAGYRRREDLWSLAMDADARVRSTALHWLCRISAVDDVVAWDRIMPRLVSEPAEIRAAIIRGLPRALPSSVERRWPAMLDDPSRDVRAAVLARIHSIEVPRPEALMNAVRDRLKTEADARLQRAMRRLLHVTLTPRPRTPGSAFPLMRLY